MDNDLPERYLIKQIISEKSVIVESKNFVTSMGDGEQVHEEYFNLLLDKLESKQIISKSPNPFITEDIVTGLKLFSIMIYCSESVKLYKFLHEIFTTQSPRTLFKTIINTIQSDNIKESRNLASLEKIYEEIDNLFHLQLGKILLAISSPKQIHTMINNVFPPIYKYIEMIKMCLNYSNCEDVNKLIKELGNYL